MKGWDRLDGGLEALKAIWHGSWNNRDGTRRLVETEDHSEIIAALLHHPWVAQEIWWREAAIERRESERKLDAVEGPIF